MAGTRIWECVDQAKHHLPVISHVSHSAWISLKYPFFYLELWIPGANGDSSYDRKRTLPVKFGFIVRSDHHDSPKCDHGETSTISYKIITCNKDAGDVGKEI